MKDINYTQLLKGAFRANGHVVLKDSDVCESWKKNHPVTGGTDCRGCPGEKVCAKMYEWYDLTLGKQPIPRNFFEEV